MYSVVKLIWPHLMFVIQSIQQWLFEDSFCICASMHKGKTGQHCASLPPSVAQQDYFFFLPPRQNFGKHAWQNQSITTFRRKKKNLFIYFIALPPELILSSCASWPRRAGRWSSDGSSPFVKGWWRTRTGWVRREGGSWAVPGRPRLRCCAVWTCTMLPPTCCCVGYTSRWSSGWSSRRYPRQHTASRPWQQGRGCS